MEGRLTVCNMSIEAGARAGMIAPDDTTFAYLAGRPFAPQGAEWDAALARWRALPYRRRRAASTARWRSTRRDIEPDGDLGQQPRGRAADHRPRARSGTRRDAERREAMQRALAYMGLDARHAARRTCRSIACSSARAPTAASRTCAAPRRSSRGRKVAAGVEAWVVPGSGLVKAQAEAEGLDRVFRDAGFQWRYRRLLDVPRHQRRSSSRPGERCASTSNRNFVGPAGARRRARI